MTKAVLTEAEVQDYRNQLGDGFLMNSNGVEQLLNAITDLRSRNVKLRTALERVVSWNAAKPLSYVEWGSIMEQLQTILAGES